MMDDPTRPSRSRAAAARDALASARLAVASLAVIVALLTGCGSGDGGDGHSSAARDGDESIPIDDVIEHIEARRERRRQARADQRRQHDDVEAAREPTTVARPPIVQDPIPFPETRKNEMAAYAQRHYGTDTYVLAKPRVIVEHVAVAPSAAAVKATFSPDNPDPELHELPQVCSHFVIDTDGTIHQLVPLSIMCRHTVGLNYTAIGIEHAGFTDADLLSNPAELAASIRLTTWLRCKYGIDVKNVIGHNESLSSPYHQEKVPALRNQTHGDMQHGSMLVYRRELAAHSCRAGLP